MFICSWKLYHTPYLYLCSNALLFFYAWYLLLLVVLLEPIQLVELAVSSIQMIPTQALVVSHQQVMPLISYQP